MTRIDEHVQGEPASDAKSLDLRAFLCGLLVMAVGWIAGTSVSIAEEPLPSEYQVKAAFLINFPQYVDSVTSKAAAVAVDFLEKPFLREHLLTSLFPRADGGQAEYEARPIAD